MKKGILYLLIALLFASCGDSQQANSGQPKAGVALATPPGRTMHVYNMGGVPSKDMNELVAALRKIYPDTKYAGEMALVDIARLKNDPKGNNRYLWSKLFPLLSKTTLAHHGITLVIVNAEVCNWDEKTRGSHANFGMSNLGGRISAISYQRLRVNRLNNQNDMMKVVIHELGHSVGGLVADRKDDGCHCPDKNCLMKNARNGFPYRGLTSFCPSCASVMKAKGFNLAALRLRAR